MSEHKSGRPEKSGQNSPLSLETLLCTLLDDLGTSLGLPIGSNDLSTLRRRFQSEGPRFAYVTLKNIQNDLLTALEFGALPHDSAFAKIPGSRVPKFLQGLWLRIVDQDGQLLPHLEKDYAAVQAVKALLQVGTALTKYEDAFPKELIPKYLEEFVAVDSSLSALTFPDALLSAAGNVITQVFDRFSLSEIVPKHGPGAVATGEKGEQKWAFSRLIYSANRFYPFYDYFMQGRRIMEPSEKVAWLTGLTRVNTGTAKLLFVPKTAESLRTISMEPLELQFLQQGQMSSMVSHLQSHPITRGRVNFERQDINQNLALVHSSTRAMATIDLSSASDRLALSLVQRLFSNVEDNVLRYLEATRSSHTELPDGTRMEMHKFAPMGSAVCFPVQSISFFALCVAAIQMDRNIPLHEAAQSVYVYGDDIVVPSEDVHTVTMALEMVGLKVNRLKTFVRGFFRESCGMFAFGGYEVTPLRFRKSFPRSRGDGRGIASWLAYAHDCVKRGYLRTAEYIYTTIETLTGKLPAGLEGCGYFCRLVFSEYELATQLSSWPHIRWNDGLQRIELKALGLFTPRVGVRFELEVHRLLRDLITDYSLSDPTTKADGRSAKPKSAWHPIV